MPTRSRENYNRLSKKEKKRDRNRYGNMISTRVKPGFLKILVNTTHPQALKNRIFIMENKYYMLNRNGYLIKLNSNKNPTYVLAHFKKNFRPRALRPRR